MTHTHIPEQHEEIYQHSYGGEISESVLEYCTCKCCGVELELIGNDWMPKFAEDPEHLDKLVAELEHGLYTYMDDHIDNLDAERVITEKNSIEIYKRRMEWTQLTERK